MTCQECQIELFEDAPGREALIHMGECDDCRTLAREIRFNADALASLQGEELAAKPFVYPRRSFRPIWGLAAAAALVLGLGLPRLFDREVPAIPEVTPPVIQAKVELPVPAPEITKRTQAPVRRLKPRPEPETALPVEEPAQPLLVKMLTPDPDVVIYWLIDPPKGEVL
jgi:hypothetical protein